MKFDIYLIFVILFLGISGLSRLGSLQPITLDPEKVKRRMAFKAIQQDLADPRLKIRNIYDLLALVTMAAAAVKSFAGSGPIHTDDLPIRLCEAFLRPCSGQAFAEAISRLPNQEIASLRNPEWSGQRQ